MPNQKKKPGKYKHKKQDRVKSTKKRARKCLENALKNKPASIKSPYVCPLCCKGLVQQDLKHN